MTRLRGSLESRCPRGSSCVTPGACRRKCCCGGKLMLGLPGWADCPPHCVYDGVHVVAAERPPMHRPTALLSSCRERLAIHDRVSAGIREIVRNTFLDRRRKSGARADRYARNRDRQCRGQCCETLPRAACRGRVHALDKRHGSLERYSSRPRTVQVAAHRPGSFMVIWVRWQTIGEIDAPAIEDLATGPHSDEYRRVAVLGDTDNCSPPPIGCQDGIFARKFRARVASVVSHLGSIVVIVRMCRTLL